MATSAEVLGHWHHSVENFTTSALDFYKDLEQTLVSKHAPTVVERVEWLESGVLSAKRTYLRIVYGRYQFDICAAPFGEDFFFSWWLTKKSPQLALLYGCLSIFGLLMMLGA